MLRSWYDERGARLDLERQCKVVATERLDIEDQPDGVNRYVQSLAMPGVVAQQAVVPCGSRETLTVPTVSSPDLLASSVTVRPDFSSASGRLIDRYTTKSAAQTRSKRMRRKPVR